MRFLSLVLVASLLFSLGASALSDDLFDMDLFSAADEDEDVTSFDADADIAIGDSDNNNNVGGFAPAAPTDPLVVEATNHVFEQLNKALRDCKKPALSSLRAVVAKKDPSTKYVLLKLELESNDGKKFMADVRKVPRFLHQFRRGADGQNARKHWKTQSVVPNPCSNAQLAYSFAEIDAHNSNPDKTWTATMYPEMIGTTKQAFTTGVVMPDISEIPAHRIQYYSEADVEMGDEPPESYDFRTEFPDCRATKEVLDQGACGSCYAQATATSFGASLYKVSNKKANIKLSARDMADCVNACEGGWAGSVYDKQNTQGGYPEESCDPDTRKNEGCGPKCNNGMLWKNKGYKYIRAVTGTSPVTMEKAMRQAVMQYGPLWVAFGVPPSFFSYKTGVFIKKPDENTDGGHAVTVVGWGTEGDVPYWICQNSWSAGWGEKGYFRIRRGTDEVKIESWGVVAVEPETSPANLSPDCKKECVNGGALELPCNCKCINLYAGDTCETCPEITCQNGGTPDNTSCKCICPPGIGGANCGEVAFKFNTDSVCRRAGGPDLEITWNTPSAVGSYCDLSGEDGSWNDRINLCGYEHQWSKENPNCPATGKAVWTDLRTQDAGSYRIECARFLGKNEFGQSRGYQWMGRGGEKLTARVTIKNCAAPSPTPRPGPRPTPRPGPRPTPRPTARPKKAVNVGSSSEESSDDASNSNGDAVSSTSTPECAAKEGRCVSVRNCKGVYFTATLGCTGDQVCCKGLIVPAEAEEDVESALFDE